jgi:membrane-associated protein
MRHHLIAILGLEPDKLLRTFGTLGLFAIIFAESGLLVGFFLPGDSLLVAAGLFSARGDLPNIAIIAVGCALAAIIGDQVGYYIGNKAGPRIFNRPDSRLFKHENVEAAEEFFEDHGPKAIILARFVPIIRTFTPIIAGVSNMKYRTFTIYNIIGGILWAAGLTIVGYSLGTKFPWLVDRIEVIAIVIIVLSLVPMAIEVRKHRARQKLKAADAANAAALDEII